MQLTDKEILELETYWRNELSPPELARLQERLTTDPDFAQTAQKWFATFNLLRPVVDPVLKSQLQAFEKTLPSLKPNYTLRILAIAASIAVLTLVAWLVWRDNPPAPPAPMAYTQYVEHYPWEGLVLGATKPTVDIKTIRLYENKQYTEAIPALETVAVNPADSSVLFYLSIAYLRTARPDPAIPILEHLQRQTGRWQEAAEWNLAVAYAMRNRREDALRTIENIKQKQTHYTTKAVALQTEILNSNPKK